MPDDDRPTVPDFPDSLEPHELLEILVGELRTPLQSIDGWARIIARDTNLEMLTHEAAESIPVVLAQAHALLDSAERYLKARGVTRDR